MTDATMSKEQNALTQTDRERRRFLQAATIGSVAAAGALFPATGAAQVKATASRFGLRLFAD